MNHIVRAVNSSCSSTIMKNKGLSYPHLIHLENLTHSIAIFAL